MNRSDQLVHVLGRKIASGDYVTGEILPKVEDLSQIYNVSRTVVRESLRVLSTMGFVRSNQRAGTVVLPRSEWRWWHLDVLTWVLEDENNTDLLLHLSEVRLGLEPMAAALATQRGTDQEFEEIKEAFNQLEKSIGDEMAWAKADVIFHESILQASHNHLLINTVRTLRKALLVSREKTLAAAKELPESPYDSPTREVLERHRLIYEAVIARDADKAHQSMYELILRTIKILKYIYNKN